MPLIALEGIDKSGKGTQAELLLSKLKMTKYKAKSIAFPDYGTPLGKEINKFLRGKVDFCPEVRQLLYVANRWERRKDIDTWLKDGNIVVADRYIPSGIVYGLANDLNLNWITALEERLPSSDLVIVIDVPVKKTFERIDRENRDIYERNKQFLEKVQKIYLELANKLDWTVINGDAPIEKVQEEVWKNVLKLLSNK
jgi:dTMP kinase